MERIIVAEDHIKAFGFKNVSDYISAMCNQKPFRDRIEPWNGEIAGNPVYARVDAGRWLADCGHCPGAMYVSDEEPIFFCLSCGNHYNNHCARPVVFPEEKAEIEKLLLERPVKTFGKTPVEQAKNAIALVGEGNKKLGRFWNLGETLEDLREQNAPLYK